MKNFQPNEFISKYPNWDSFFENASKIESSLEKGILFERLTQLFLQVSPKYRSKFKKVWLLKEIPIEVRRHLKLPDSDEGIDLIAETFEGEFWAIQAKFRTDTDKALTYSELSTFSTLAFVTCREITLGLVSHTSKLPIRKRDLLGKLVEVGFDQWSGIDAELWEGIRAKSKGRHQRIKPRTKLNHQKKAVRKIKAYFADGANTRGRVLMPCGSGKSLVAFWAAEALEVDSVVLAVPSLYLIGQALKDWAREFLAKGIRPDWLVICSDETTAELNKDEFVGHSYELGIDTTTDPEIIKAFLSKKSDQKKIIFVTYHSSKKLIEGARAVDFEFGLTVLDEAHKTVGYRTKHFAALVADENYQTRYRIFLTATERVLRGQNDDVLSMNDSADYGETIYQMTFGQAISANPQIISDYKIVTIAVLETRIKQLMDKNASLFEEGGEFHYAEAKDVGSCLAMLDLFEKHSGKKAISFHSSIKRSEDFKKLSKKICTLTGTSSIEHYTVSSKLSSGKRAALVREFAQSNQSLITNARCLTEGVDVPEVDTVIFADPKASVVDIVQASGRALRLHEGKEFGLILLPLIVPENLDFDEFAEQTEFRHIARVVTSLSVHDERIVEQFRLSDRNEGGGGGGGPFIPPEIDKQIKINLNQFKENLIARLWSNIGRANWRPFKEAREYARSLGLKSQQHWNSFTGSDEKPKDIPSNPYSVYRNTGWLGMGDWLGTGTIAPHLIEYRPFVKAREFARNLKLKSHKEWRTYTFNKGLPEDIPSVPNQTYKMKGWKGWGDWLGTQNVAPRLRRFKTFEEARSFARSLNLKSSNDWQKYAQSNQRPTDIPYKPERTYKNEGWVSMGDWLGTGFIATRQRKYRSFEEAREFVRSLHLIGQKEWRVYAQSNQRPTNIPYKPERTYKNEGWTDFGDWLGTGRIANTNREYKTFQEARAYVRSLGLKSGSEWKKLSKSGERPLDIPSNPNTVYKNSGWISMGDWLGTGVIASQKKKYRSFVKAREFVRSLKLKSTKDWRAYTKSGELPNDIPANPHNTYKIKGWKGYGDWLGTQNVAPRLRRFKTFEEARDYVKNIGLKSMTDWRVYSKSGERPSDIPSAPERTYKRSGWKGYGDWLGTGTIQTSQRQYKEFTEARAYVRSLGLKSQNEWELYKKSRKLPKDIPLVPRNTYKKSGWISMGDWLGTEKPD